MSNQKKGEVEYDKAGRAICCGSPCGAVQEKLSKGEFRIGRMEKSEKFDGYIPRWYHAQCFFHGHDKRDWSVSDFKGFDDLHVDDKKQLELWLGVKRQAPGGSSGPPDKKRKDDKGEQEKHDEQLWALREQLATVKPTSVLKSILNHNGVDSRGNAETLEKRCADVMLHGVPGLCPQKLGSGNDEMGSVQVQGSAKDPYTVTALRKKGETVPFKIKCTCPSYEGSGKECKHFTSWKAIFKWTKCSGLMCGARLRYDDGHLRCPGFLDAYLPCPYVSVDDKKDRVSFKLPTAKERGGKGSEWLDKFKFKVVARPTSAIKERGAEQKKAKVTQQDAILFENEDGEKKKFFLTSDDATGQAGAVDPDSDKDPTTHKVLSTGGVIYTCILNKTNIQAGKNAFYKLQIIQHKTSLETCLFRKWGTVGATGSGVEGGDHKLVEGQDVKACIKDFEAEFERRTKNKWALRNLDPSDGGFMHKPGMYNLSQLATVEDMPETGEFLVDLQQKMVAKKQRASDLGARIISLMELIYDEKVMQDTLIEMEIDIEKMPLGKIKREQLLKGMKALSDIQTLIADKELPESERQNNCVGKSNKFYTFVPTSFGLNGPTARHIIDSEDKLKAKIEMMESLMQIEIAFKLVGESANSECRIDDNYKKLNTNFALIDKTHKTWKLIDTYLQNTHAATHSSYTLELIDLFEIERNGEEERFRPFEANHNRMLLWHGSRISNWVGILSQGLRIAPPEAPVTGYMFGKGVYFADMSSKSANYCFTNASKNEGLLTLSEVAMGDMHELTNSNSLLPVGKPADKLSVKGCGRTFPDPAQNRELCPADCPNSFVVPCGKPSPSLSIATSLQYNEYIVYDTAQIKSRFLLRVKFHYKH